MQKASKAISWLLKALTESENSSKARKSSENRAKKEQNSEKHRINNTLTHPFSAHRLLLQGYNFSYTVSSSLTLHCPSSAVSLCCIFRL